MKTPIWLTIRHPLLARSCPSFIPIIAARRIGTSCSREHETFSLPDGRVLGYAEYGSQTGYPVMFFHGFSSSRLEAHGLDRIARRRHLRIIAPDRPGFGLSTPQPHRRITDWPADVRALANHCDLSRFAVLGGSGGGPYALACAYALPREMLSAVGIMAGAPPWQAGTQDLPLTARATSLAAKNWPTGLRRLTDLLMRTLRTGFTYGPAINSIERWLEENQQENDGGTKIQEKRERLLRMAFEGFAQGAEGFVHEAQLLTQDWGFRFEDVVYDRIRLWHGTHDTNAPVRMIRYMVERLPHSDLDEFEGENHWTLARHLDKILSDLVPEEKTSRRSLEA